MTEYRIGEIVDITIKGARVDECTGQTVAITYVSHRGTHRDCLPIDVAEVEITRVAPAEWPPRPGDLWRDHKGEPWFAVLETADDQYEPGDPPFLMSMGRDVVPAAEVIKICGPLTLVHREATDDWCGCDNVTRDGHGHATTCALNKETDR